MRVKCEYCGSMIDDKASFCPNCGAPNPNMKRTADKTPKTIEELKAWYEARHLPPPEVTRFFIGVDYKEPRAFGIYKEGNKCIVYKNKDDGTRAIRYQGEDEAYAVNEIFLKLKSEILNQKARNQNRRQGSGKRAGSSSCMSPVLSITGIVIMGILFAAAVSFNWPAALIAAAVPVAAFFIIRYLWKKKGKNITARSFLLVYMIYMIIANVIIIGVSPDPSRASYYSYQDKVYAKYDDDYYIYDPIIYDYSPIDYTFVPSEVISDPDEYAFDSENMEWDNNYRFEDSGYYEDNIKPEESSRDNNYSDNDNDSDWDWDWDSGDSWDSGGTDWGSDW